MKYNIAILILLSCSYFGSCQKRIAIDEKGDTINKKIFGKKWANKNSSLFRWDYIGKDKKRYQKLIKGLYLKGDFDYSNIKSELENLISSKIPDSNTLLIEFRFKDDLCTSTWDNKWTRNEINMRKHFTNPMKKELNKKRIIYICLFEKGIKLSNKNKDKKEYFFLDKRNFFREKLFKKRAMCGSFAAIKSNGQTLIRNGEYRADWFAQHLKPENWSLFFKPSEKENTSTEN